MERRQKTNNDFDVLKKRLEMKINEHKMLTNTLHEAFRKEDTSEETLNSIKSAIDSTVSEINILREQINNEGATYAAYNAYNKMSFFDKIGKKDELPIKVISCFEPKYNSKKPYNIKSFDEIVKDEGGKEHKVKHTTSIENVKTDNILFCNRFLCDLSVIGIPETMVKWLCQFKGSEDSSNRTDNFIEVQIYDFVDDNGIPVLAKLNAYDGRKFTIEIKHLDPTGCVVYKEKYNGCYLDGEIIRDSLRYADSEPSTITFKIYYDGVSYEASFQKR
jgi:hypothetical protein